MMAFRAGAVQIDGSTRRLGAGAGDTPVEAFVAAAEKLGIRTGIDTLKIIDAAEDVVAPIMDEECRLDRLALLMGYAGGYSSFLKHAFRQGERHGVSSAEILVRAGQRKLVGGQEDQLIDIAIELAAEAHRASLPSPSRPGPGHAIRGWPGIYERASEAAARPGALPAQSGGRGTLAGSPAR
jgi:4-hydroxy 2-oxovalerate aldolase